MQVYGSQLGARDGYYFPYVVEERLTQSLSAGDAKAVEDVLSLLQTENFVRRSLNRSRMRQLNRRIVEILSAQTGVIVEENADLMALNELAFDYKGDCEPYFERLNTLCQALCSEVTQQKNARRSENVKAIEEYIRKNYHNPNLGLAMVSAEFNLSEGYLSAIFKRRPAPTLPSIWSSSASRRPVFCCRMAARFRICRSGWGTTASSLSAVRSSA